MAQNSPREGQRGMAIHDKGLSVRATRDHGSSARAFATIPQLHGSDHPVMTWKKARGKLGPLAPLIGTWHATADSPMGPVACTRVFTVVLGGKYIQLKATWRIAEGGYEEIALFGVDDGALAYWSYTSDGKRSSGVSSNATDIHLDAICFEAHMPAGMARQVYWPNDEGGFNWAVESKNKKGWNRFVLHHYTAVK
jgi:hypothetical protein